MENFADVINSETFNVLSENQEQHYARNRIKGREYVNITKFGSFTANFKALPPTIPPEYIATLFTVVATAFIGSWLTPTIIGWRKAKKEVGKVQTRHLAIKSLYDDGNVDEKDIPGLDKLKDDVMDDYAKGKISEQHYRLLNEKFSDNKNNQQSNSTLLLPSSQKSTLSTQGSPIKR